MSVMHTHWANFRDVSTPVLDSFWPVVSQCEFSIPGAWVMILLGVYLVLIPVVKYLLQTYMVTLELPLCVQIGPFPCILLYWTVSLCMSVTHWANSRDVSTPLCNSFGPEGVGVAHRCMDRNAPRGLPVAPCC